MDSSVSSAVAGQKVWTRQRLHNPEIMLHFSKPVYSIYHYKTYENSKENDSVPVPLLERHQSAKQQHKLMHEYGSAERPQANETPTTSS